MSFGKKQRSTKAERQAAEGVLRGLIEYAYHNGESVVEYGADGVPDPEKKASTLHQALNDYRKRIREKQSENFELYLMTNACSILKKSDTCVAVKRKIAPYSDRTQTILDVVALNPELGLGPANPSLPSLANANIDSILKDFGLGE